MFSSNGKDNQPKPAKNGSNGSALVNLIGAGTKIQGEVNSAGDIRIDGKVSGVISSSAKIVVGPTGNIDGDVVCQNADISGHIEGKIVVSELLYLKSTAHIEGEITTAKIVVEAGAKFNGTCNMGVSTKPQVKHEEGAEKTLKKATA